MSGDEIKKIADEADIIVRGYAFTQKDGLIRIFDTVGGESAMVITPDGTMVETNMNEIEQVIVLNIWKRDSKYMEA